MAERDSGAVYGATITVQQHASGLAIGLEFHGKPTDQDQRFGMESLALTGVEAMRDWIRDNCNVKDEEVVHRPGQKQTAH